MDFSRTVGTTAIKLTGKPVPPVNNQWQRNYKCTVRLTRSLLLPTQAYNSNHFYILRLVWFPGHMDWERRKRSLGSTRQTANADVRGAKSAQCVSLVTQKLVDEMFWATNLTVYQNHSTTSSCPSNISATTECSTRYSRPLVGKQTKKPTPTTDASR